MTSTPRATGEVWSERARLLCESHLFGKVHGVTRENVSVREEPGPGSSVSRVRVGANVGVGAGGCGGGGCCCCCY